MESRACVKNHMKPFRVPSTRDRVFEIPDIPHGARSEGSRHRGNCGILSVSTFQALRFLERTRAFDPGYNDGDPSGLKLCGTAEFG